VKKSTLCTLVFTITITALCSITALAQRRRVVVVRRPVYHTALVVRRGHPIHRILPTAVVVRPARRAVVVNAPLSFLPALVWTAAVVSRPPAERFVWQDSEAIAKDEGWVDTNFGIDGTGEALFLDIDGKATLNFAEVTFANGNVQVVDFNENSRQTGIYKLLDFTNDRHVMTVRILAKSEADDTKLAVYLTR
jgi:hypothetical protein